MRQGLPWYRREPRAFLDGCRAARLTERQFAVYTIVLDLIYDHGGETPDDPKHIASYLSDTGAAAVRNAIQQLVDIGKLYRVGDMLHQKRAENEAETREKLSEIRAKTGYLGGVSSGNSRRESKENKDIAEAKASSKPEADKRREEKKEGEAIASPKKIGKLDALGVLLGVDPETLEWCGGRSSEAVLMWTALGLTQAEIAATAKLWDGADPPARPQDLDHLMNAAAQAKRAPKPKADPKGTRLSPDWELPRPWGIWALDQGLTIPEVREIAENFKDYWLGVPAKDGRKVDWQATWRNRVRYVISKKPTGGRNGKPVGPDQRISEGGKRVDPALANIARLAGLEEASGPGGVRAGGSGDEAGPVRLGEGPGNPDTGPPDPGLDGYAPRLPLG